MVAPSFAHFELRRLCDGLVYQFDRVLLSDGSSGYKRRDQDVWIIFKPEFGWVAFDEETQTITGRPWNILPRGQKNHPPEDEWVSKKGSRSYGYQLRYCHSVK